MKLLEGSAKFSGLNLKPYPFSFKHINWCVAEFSLPVYSPLKILISSSSCKTTLENFSSLINSFILISELIDIIRRNLDLDKTWDWKGITWDWKGKVSYPMAVCGTATPGQTLEIHSIVSNELFSPSHSGLAVRICWI